MLCPKKTISDATRKPVTISGQSSKSLMKQLQRFLPLDFNLERPCELRKKYCLNNCSL